jgi:hypothetical protein
MTVRVDTGDVNRFGSELYAPDCELMSSGVVYVCSVECLSEMASVGEDDRMFHKINGWVTDCPGSDWTSNDYHFSPSKMFLQL